MERKLYYGIMAPSAVLTVVSGAWLWLGFGITGGWLYAKLALVAILVAHHLGLRKLMGGFCDGRNQPGGFFFPLVQEGSPPPLPVLVLALAAVKPFLLGTTPQTA